MCAVCDGASFYRPLKRWTLRFCVSFSVLVALLTLAAAAAHTAPAPLPRREARARPSVPAGTWDVVWSGINCRMRLEAGGGYQCSWYFSNFVGSWSPDRDGFTLIESVRPHDPDSWHSYKVRVTEVCGDWESFKGKTDCGISVRMYRVRD